MKYYSFPLPVVDNYHHQLAQTWQTVPKIAFAVWFSQLIFLFLSLSLVDSILFFGEFPHTWNTPACSYGAIPSELYIYVTSHQAPGNNHWLTSNILWMLHANFQPTDVYLYWSLSPRHFARETVEIYTLPKFRYLLFLCKCGLRNWSSRRSKNLKTWKIWRTTDLRKSSNWILAPSGSFIVGCSAWNSLITTDSNFSTDISDCLAI